MTTIDINPEPGDDEDLVPVPEHLRQLRQALADAQALLRATPEHASAQIGGALLDDARAAWGRAPEVRAARSRYGGRRLNDPSEGRW